MSKARRGSWLLSVGAFAVLLSAALLIIPSDRTAAPLVARVPPLRPTASARPAVAAAVASIHARRRYIVQSASTDIARTAVLNAGGVVTSDLSVIRAVGAGLDDGELAALNGQRVPGLQIYEDTPVTASSAAGALPETYYPSEVDASELHIGGVTGRGVTVAVIDSGMWNNQGPLQYAPTGGKSRVIAQYDVILAREQPGYYQSPLFETYSRNITDLYGHGTHVTSIIASSGVATTGKFQGVAPGVNLVAVRALDSNGMGLYSDVISAVQWVINQRLRYGIRVLNLSLGAPPSGPYWQDPLNQAVMAAWASGIVVVAAGGNRGPEPQTIDAPGDVPYVVTVGAVTDNYHPLQPQQYLLASFSSAGPTFEGFVKPDLVGMGGHNLAYAPDNGTLAMEFPQWVDEPYHDFTMSGTSQAAAVVSGVVALMLEVSPGLTPDQVKCRLMSGAHPAVNSSGDLAYTVFQQGAGLVNAHDAVYSTALGCANQGLNVLLDLAGLQHYGGRANENSSGQYYIMAQSPATGGSPVAALVGGVGSLLKTVGSAAAKVPLVGPLLKEIPLLGDGLLWNGTYTSSSGYTWSSGYTGIDVPKQE
jgi:serine protease AprX